MSGSYFCYNIVGNKLCGKDQVKHFHPEKFTKCKKCTQKLEEGDLVPLSFFEDIASDFMAEWQCNKSEATKIYKLLFQEYPFCYKNKGDIDWDFSFMRKIANNKDVSYDDKVRILTILLIKLAYQYMTTINVDPGTMTEYTKASKELVEREYISYKRDFEYGIKEKPSSPF